MTVYCDILPFKDRVYWELHPEYRAAIGIILRPDSAVVVLYHPLDRQKAETMSPFFCGKMLRKESGEIFFGKSASVVQYRKHY